MAEKKIIAVVGATGAQGSGLVRAIAGDRSGGFVARAITRDARSEEAQALRKLGAEVVSADVDDEKSLEPKKGPDGKLAFTLPMGDKKLPGIAAEDIGRCAYGIFRKGSDLLGKTIGIAGEHLTGARMAASLTRVLGREVRYDAVTPEAYRHFGFPGAEDLGNMFQFKRDFEQVFCRARSLEVSRSLNPGLQTFDAWLARNKDRIPIE